MAWRDSAEARKLGDDLRAQVNDKLVAIMQNATASALSYLLYGHNGMRSAMPAVGEPKNYTLTTLASVAGALGYRVEVVFQPTRPR